MSLTKSPIAEAVTLHEKYFQTVISWEDWLTKKGKSRPQKLLLYQLIDTTIGRSETQEWKDSDLAETSELTGALDASRYENFESSVVSNRSKLESAAQALGVHLASDDFKQAFQSDMIDYVRRASVAATVTTALGHSAAGRAIQHSILTDPDHALHPRNVCFPENPDPVIFPGGEKARIADQSWGHAKTVVGSMMTFVNNLSGAVVGAIKTAETGGESVHAVTRLTVPFLLAMDDLFKADLPTITRKSTLELLDLVHRGDPGEVLAAIPVSKLKTAMDNATSDLATKTGDLFDLQASTGLVGLILNTAGFADLLAKYAEHGEQDEPPTEELLMAVLSFAASAGSLAEAIEQTNGSWVDEALPTFKGLSSKLGKRMVKVVSKFAILGPVGDFVDLITAPPKAIKNLQVNDYSVAAGHTMVAAGAGMSLLVYAEVLAINPLIGIAVIIIGTLIVTFTVDPPLERWANECYFGGNAGNSSLYDDPEDLVYRWYEGDSPNLDRHIAGYFSTIYGFSISTAQVTKLDEAGSSYIYRYHDDWNIDAADRSNYHFGQVTIKTSLAYKDTKVNVRTILHGFERSGDNVPPREYDQYEGQLYQGTPTVSAERQNLRVYQYQWSSQWKHTVTAPQALRVPKLKASVQTNADGTTDTIINEWTLEVADTELPNLFSAVELDYYNSNPHIEVTLTLEQLVGSLATQAGINPGTDGGPAFTMRAGKRIDDPYT